MGQKPLKHKIDLDHRMNDTKLLWHMDRVKAWLDRGERIAPIHIDMGIAKFCNIRCVYCYGENQEQCMKFIQKDALLNLVSNAKKIGIKSIGFIGDGEPTCNPNMHEALEAATCDMAISTNGVLLDTDEKRENVLKNCKWMRFNISAGTREGYKKIHSRDYFDKVVENIKAMVRLKKEKGYECEVGLQSVYVPGMMDNDMIELSKLAVESEVDYLLIKQCSLPDGNLKVGQIEFDVNDYDKGSVQKVLQECEDMSNDKTKIIPKWALMEQKGIRPYDGCLGIPFLVQISGNGDVYPCGQMFQKEKYKEYFMGNLHDMPFGEIVKSERYWEVVEKMKKFNVHKDCTGACRQDKVNEFLFNYDNKPKGINFI